MRAGAVLGKLLGSVVLLACVAAATLFGIRAFVVPVHGSGGGGYAAVWSTKGGVESEEPSKWQYTPEDVKLLETLHAKGWESKSVNDFNKALADWTDEDQFHAREDSYQRLERTYEDEGTYASFFRRTVRASMNEASTRHYSGHCTRQRDSFYDDVVKERKADVFGDPYTVFQVQLSYQVKYTVIDGDKLTVGERDRILDAYREEVRKYLDGFTEKQLLDEKGMSKKLEGYLEQLDRKLSTDLMKLEESSLAWYDAWGPSSEG